MPYRIRDSSPVTFATGSPAGPTSRICESCLSCLAREHNKVVERTSSQAIEVESNIMTIWPDTYR